MASVYILYSPTSDCYYVGSCIDMEQRLKEHNSSRYRSSFTARASDWEVFLVIDNLGYRQSRAIESHIKRMKSRKYLENLTRYPAMVDRLVQEHS